jgi:hypothetical protein
MKTPVELPSGQLLDLSRCITLWPLHNQEYELLMEGCSQPLKISRADAMQLKQVLIDRPQIPVWSPAEQQVRNQAALQKLQEMIDGNQNRPCTPEAQQRFDEFQQLIDEQRPVGQKLFAE